MHPNSSYLRVIMIWEIGKYLRHMTKYRILLDGARRNNWKEFIFIILFKQFNSGFVFPRSGLSRVQWVQWEPRNSAGNYLVVFRKVSWNHPSPIRLSVVQFIWISSGIYEVLMVVLVVYFFFSVKGYLCVFITMTCGLNKMESRKLWTIAQLQVEISFAKPFFFTVTHSFCFKKV